ncbi:HI0074 family nucleotidyltransferase substrate-binding subunit [Desertibacillus haloalkaliphilus]|uniref:HI0074 family nucleotidyltransferase substrate-binding subunit n=1 Tax=Desertibacillus haloalkaliphilus TaxID=1328930 RepID=UPI001C253ABB|nr:HI0074 family nucleotidyltransferase substrate-binding subunit [Desertibacillus haloalkaliphilus]MBU8906561.1 HI0074 family nucleotidyltransferase substrate-binding subunit [Desertibacillus haloalkaliphilus]
MSLTRYGLSKATFYKIINLFKEYKESVEEVILFGSRARGDYKETSDIDLAIKFRRNNNEQLYQMKDDLSRENIIYTFDIIDYDKVSNMKLKSYIDKEGKTIFLSNSQGEEMGNVNKLQDKLSDLEKAFKKLQESLQRDPRADDIVIDATIQRFEFTYELSWKLMKSYLEYNGVTDVPSPRKTMKQAFKEGIITEGDKWLAMLEDRNRTSHTYDEEIALAIFEHIKEDYAKLFGDLITEMKKQFEDDEL